MKVNNAKVKDFIKGLDRANIYLAGPETYGNLGWDITIILDRQAHLNEGAKELADTLTEEVVHDVSNLTDLEHPEVHKRVKWLMGQQAWREAVYRRLAEELFKYCVRSIGPWSKPI